MAIATYSSALNDRALCTSIALTMVRRAYVQALSQVTGRRRSSPPLPLMCRIHVRHLETPTAQDISGIDVTASAPLRSSHFPFRR